MFLAQENPVGSNVQGRSRLLLNKSLAANAGASALGIIPVPKGTVSLVQLIAKVVAGTLTGDLAVTVTNADETFHRTAHGLVTGQPVQVAGTAVPAGITATSTYYVKSVTADTFTLHPTAADANGGTNTVAVTTDGTAVVVRGVQLFGLYVVTAAVKNLNGVTSLVGTPDVVALEDVAAWAFTVTADDTNDAVQITGTPDVYLATSFEVEATVLN